MSVYFAFHKEPNTALLVHTVIDKLQPSSGVESDLTRLVLAF